MGDARVLVMVMEERRTRKRREGMLFLKEVVEVFEGLRRDDMDCMMMMMMVIFFFL